MVFKPKFFLDLGGEGQQQPVSVAPIAIPAASGKTPPSEAKVAPAKAASSSGAPQVSGAAAPATPASSVTTAEAIAAELAAAQANRPAPSLATFAPACVTPGGALPRRRRRGGADLAGFREMAQGMMRS